MGAARNIRHGSVGFGSERGAILTALMLTTGLIAIDATILATAVPSVVADLGQFDQFPWLFSVYLLAQAVSVPIYSKLADTLGRKPVVLAGIGLFLLGSILSGVAWTKAVMLQVGTAVRQLTGRADLTEPSHVRLDVLLRSGLGQAVLVANLVGEPSAQSAAARISRLSLE